MYPVSSLRHKTLTEGLHIAFLNRITNARIPES